MCPRSFDLCCSFVFNFFLDFFSISSLNSLFHLIFFIQFDPYFSLIFFFVFLSFFLIFISISSINLLFHLIFISNLALILLIAICFVFKFWMTRDFA
jgi:hypothetical protein